MSKRFKDPVYGYIEFEDFIADRIIDSASFQRLRDIIQTSYAPLYASAVHNRFVHSLGVFYLANLAFNSIKESIPNQVNKERCSIVFRYACLLHDVGHSPFSHSGEHFFLDKDSTRNELHSEILELIDAEESKLKIEIDSNKNSNAAPHELMSAIVGLRQFGDLFENSEEREFFTRCITGYQYVEGCDSNKSIYNCIISLLNSDVIDVDKLDYLIRDAHSTGFNTVIIDYKRLLGSLTLFFDSKKQIYSLVYKKSAISVIENAIYAHDVERKWIQSHPVVQYESYLIKHGIEQIHAAFPEQALFSYQCLSSEGIKLDNGMTVRLLSDSDIIFLMKNLPNDKLIEEFFTRGKRMHPLWKSESEYKSIFNRGFGENIYELVESEFDALAKYLNYISNSYAINLEAKEKIIEDICKTEALFKHESEGSFKQQLVEQVKDKKKHLKWIEGLEEFSKKQEIDFEFIILKADQFNSSFGKTGFENILILFDNDCPPCPYIKVTNALSASKSERKKFYYLYYRRTDRNKKIDIGILASTIGQLAMQETYIK